MTGFLPAKVHEQPRCFALHVGAPPNRLATKHCEPRRDVRRKTDPGLELRGRENLQLTQVTSKGARATAPPSLTNSVQAFCYPRTLWRPFAAPGEVEGAAEMALANQPSAGSRCALPTLGSSPADHRMAIGCAQVL